MAKCHGSGAVRKQTVESGGSTRNEKKKTVNTIHSTQRHRFEGTCHKVFTVFFSESHNSCPSNLSSFRFCFDTHRKYFRRKCVCEVGVAIEKEAESERERERGGGSRREEIR